MVPLLLLSHLLALLLPCLFVIRATPSPSPAPAPAPAIVSLPSRPQIDSSHTGTAYAQAQSHAQSRLEAQRVYTEHDLLPFVLVSTIDGGLHAVERNGGKIKWSLKDGVNPLVGGGAVGKGLEEFIVEPLSGDLYVFEEEDGDETPKIRKLPLSVEQLIDLSPFTFPHSPSRMFTGSKQTSLLTLDLRTGEQLDYFGSHSLNHSSRNDFCANDQLLDEMDRSARDNRDTLFVGRTDYRLVIHSKPHHQSPSSQYSLSGRKEGVDEADGIQEIVYSTYTPNSYDKPLADYWAKSGSEERLWDEDGTESKRVRVELGYDGSAVGIEQGSGVLWSRSLGSIGIAVYDILVPLSHSSANPILVPQPRSRSPPNLGPPGRPGRHPNPFTRPPSTYIGTLPSYLTLPSSSPSDPNEAQNGSGTEESDSETTSSHKPLLFALSSDSYPLVNLAPPPRPGDLAEGSFLLTEDLPEHDQLLPYLLDPPAEDAVPVSLEPTREAINAEDAQHSTGRKWLWFLMGCVAALAVALPAWTRWHRSSIVGQSATPPDDRVPLLAPLREKELPVSPSESDQGTKEGTSAVRAARVTFVEPTLENDNLRSQENDQVTDNNTTPKKKTNRRRVRGKKKRPDATSSAGERLDEEDGEEDNGEGSSGSTPPSTLLTRDEKPLPDLPRVLSVSDPVDLDEKEKLEITDEIIGEGSQGTVVLKGTWGGRPVAVKRLFTHFTRLASQEVKLLQASDDHENVIRYYCQERRDMFLYIALDLCQASLANLIESPTKYSELYASLDTKKALSQVTAGVKHLHSMKIIHRDIKPQNVLVSKGKDGKLRMLVSDFGLARRLAHDQSSFAPTANNVAGTLGWRAPECIRGQVRLNDLFDRTSPISSSNSSSASLLDMDGVASMDEESEETPEGEGKTEDGKPLTRLTKAVDLFALGCLYFWVINHGEHPYGEAYDRESNIVKGDIVNMSKLEIFGEEGVEAKELIGRMLSNDPSDRPDTGACLTHPFFWTPAKRLAFLCDASDRFEIMELDPPEPTLVMLETNATTVVGKDWHNNLDKVFINSLGKYRKYKGNSVRDLLRAMRNKKHHYQDLEPAVKRHMGQLPDGFLHYFTSRFPELFLHVYFVVRDSMLRHESMFAGYFDDGT